MSVVTSLWTPSRSLTWYTSLHMSRARLGLMLPKATISPCPPAWVCSPCPLICRQVVGKAVPSLPL